MNIENAKVALILGHPGHELRIHRFLEIYKPFVYILTDGSGAKGKSRLHRTKQVLSYTGAIPGSILGRFTDLEIYELMINHNIQPLLDLVSELVSELDKNNINFIAGDSNEGFSPTHDLCRYIVNAVVKEYSILKGKPVPNFEFYLEGPPHHCPEDRLPEAICIQLDDAEFQRKFEAAQQYPEISKELERFIGKYGKKPFQTEYLWPVKNVENPIGWKTPQPTYELVGQERIKDKVFKTSISFQEHLLPLAKQLYHENPVYK